MHDGVALMFAFVEYALYTLHCIFRSLYCINFMHFQNILLRNIFEGLSSL